MRRTIRTGLGQLALFGALLCMLASPSAQRPAADFEALPFAPRRYVAYRAPSALTLDGKLNEPAWAAAAWSEPFVDIEGDSRPQPALPHAGEDAVGRRVTSTSPPRWRSPTSGER